MVRCNNSPKKRQKTKKKQKQKKKRIDVTNKQCKKNFIDKP